MGLDMYLEATTSVSQEVIELIRDIKLKGLEKYMPTSITFEIGYWRKANAIHGWFVKNVQKGVDDCDRYYVSSEKLQELYDNCKTVLSDISKANDLIPTTRGLFFGNYEYDEHYKDDLNKTIYIIDKIFENPDHDMWSLYYSSSW
jgi:hypothetical protein